MSTRAVLVLLLVGCGGGSSQVDAEPEPNPFLGSWRMTEFDGMPDPGVVVWTFGETDVAINSGFSGTYTYDAAADPSRIELAIANATPNPNAAIYRFDATTILTLKVQDSAQARAVTFDVEDGYDLFVMSRL